MAEKVERTGLSLPRELLERIDDYRYRNRIPSRAEAIRRLVEKALEAEGERPVV